MVAHRHTDLGHAQRSIGQKFPGSLDPQSQQRLVRRESSCMAKRTAEVEATASNEISQTLQPHVLVEMSFHMLSDPPQL